MADTKPQQKRAAPKPKPKSGKRTRKKPKKPGLFARVLRRVRRGVVWAICGVLGLIMMWTALYAWVNPPTTPYMWAQSRQLNIVVYHRWIPLEEVAPVMVRSVIAAEDANFCLHWGLDVDAIQDAVERGRGGASTISQQVVKNVFLWHGRSWLRKAIEAVWTPFTEAVWTKRRIVEIYLNVAEFDTGVFGVHAAARHYFGVDAIDLSPTQAARLAAILPSPQNRSASNPSTFTRNRAASIMRGAATIAEDGRSDCVID